MPSVIGQPVPFLLAPQETIPKTVIIAKSAIKIFFFIVDNLVIEGFNKNQRYKFTLSSLEPSFFVI